MSDEQPKVHHHVAKILLGEPFEIAANGEGETAVATIVRKVRVITVNGEIWEQTVSGFGPEPTEMDVVKNWDATFRTDWTRVPI